MDVWFRTTAAPIGDEADGGQSGAQPHAGGPRCVESAGPAAAEWTQLPTSVKRVIRYKIAEE